MNRDLYPLPPDIEFLVAIRDELDDRQASGRYDLDPTAQTIAYRLGVSPARRHGSGAKGPQSFSGMMAPALRVCPRLRSLQQRGLLRSHTGYRSRRHWSLTQAGRDKLAEAGR